MCVWDKKKAESNLLKHGIDFADVFPVLEDEFALTISDPDEYEERFVTIGMDVFNRILVVVYTYEDEAFRIISARKATKKERKQYQLGGKSERKL